MKILWILLSRHFIRQIPGSIKTSPGGASRGRRQQMSTHSSQDAVWTSFPFRVGCLQHFRQPCVHHHVSMDVMNHSPSGNFTSCVCVCSREQEANANANAKKSDFTLNHLNRIQHNRQETTEQEKKRCLKHNNRDTRKVGEK